MAKQKLIEDYNTAQSKADQQICELLKQQIDDSLPKAESKIWHGHPVWFLEGNPIVGYSKQKAGIRLMFWSGADFDESKLLPGTRKFKDASICYVSADQVNTKELHRWLEKSVNLQWDYKNIVKRRGVLERLR